MEHFHENITGKTVAELGVGTYGALVSVGPSDTV